MYGLAMLQQSGNLIERSRQELNLGEESPVISRPTPTSLGHDYHLK